MIVLTAPLGLAAVAIARTAALRRRIRTTGGTGVTGRQQWSFWLALVALFAAAGLAAAPIATERPMTTHVIVYVLVALAGVPLLMISLPEWWVRPRLASWRLYRLARRCSRPWFAAPVAAAVVVVSHLPVTVDRLPQGATGSFVLVMAWLAAGTLLWLPVVSPLPEHRTRDRWGRCIHLGLAAAATALVSGELLRRGRVPVADLHTTAAVDAAALSDQHLAGGLLHLVVTPAVVAIVTLCWLMTSQRTSGRQGVAPARSRTSREPDAHC